MMSYEEGKREIIFQMTMSAARQMLEKGCKRSNYGKKKVWCCSQPRTVCQMKRLSENELLEVAERLLGKNSKAKVAADIDRIIVFDDTINFEFKNKQSEIHLLCVQEDCIQNCTYKYHK